MMDYATFKTVAKKKILEYFPENFKDAKVEIMPVKKVNKTKDAITIREGDDTRIAPNFYLDDMYEHYMACGDIEKVFGEMADSYMNHLEGPKEVNIPELTEDFVKEHIFMVMVNTESNRELLKDIPHREVNDCSVIYRLLMEKTDAGIATVILGNDMAAVAGMGEQELFFAATENTKRMFPPKIQSMTEIMMDMMVRDGMPKEIAEAFLADVGPANVPMWVITNDSGIQGAVNMLYEENLHKVAEKLDEDLYILPSSIHEVICVPVSMGEPEDMAEMVLEANLEAVRVEDRLSNQVYHYDKELRKLTMVTDTPNKRIDGIVAEQPLIYETKKR